MQGKTLGYVLDLQNRLIHLNLNSIDLHKQSLSGLYQFKHLTQLSLIGCNVSELSCRLFRSFPDLQHLDLSNNNLTNSLITARNPVFTRLKYLNLAYNELQSIPKFIKELAELKELNLSYNNINKIDLFISELFCLNIFDITYNKELKRLPDNLIENTNLHTVDFRYNKLTELPDWYKLNSYPPNLYVNEGNDLDNCTPANLIVG